MKSPFLCPRVRGQAWICYRWDLFQVQKLLSVTHSPSHRNDVPEGGFSSKASDERIKAVLYLESLERRALGQIIQGDLNWIFHYKTFEIINFLPVKTKGTFVDVFTQLLSSSEGQTNKKTSPDFLRSKCHSPASTLPKSSHQLEKVEISLNPFFPILPPKQQGKVYNTVHVFQKQIHNINMVYKWSTSCDPFSVQELRWFSSEEIGNAFYPIVYIISPKSIGMVRMEKESHPNSSIITPSFPPPPLTNSILSLSEIKIPLIHFLFLTFFNKLLKAGHLVQIIWHYPTS